MGTQRLTRVNELLKREIAGALFRVVDGNVFDLAAVTVTRVSVGSNLRKAQVFVSIRGDEADRQRMFRLLLKYRVRIQRLVSKDVILKYTPQLHFQMDDSVRDGDHVLELIEDVAPVEPENGDPDEVDEGDLP